MSFDPRNYSDLRKKGAISMMRVATGVYGVGVRKYDPVDGRELDPDLVKITREQVAAALAVFEGNVANCVALLAAMDELEKAPTTPSAATESQP